MKSSSPAAGVAASQDNQSSFFINLVAIGCLGWYCFIILVQTIGFRQLYRHYSAAPGPATSSKLPVQEVPNVTILRPVKGLEPQLYECLVSTFKQDYPKSKLTIYFCVASKSDPSYPVLQRVIAEFPDFDAKVFVEEDDPNLSGTGEATNLGPNPKIRNLIRGYREAKGDVVWIIDCNVWISHGVTGRMVDKLCGFGPIGSRVKPYKFVHQLPLVVDSDVLSVTEESRGLIASQHDEHDQVSSSSTAAYHLSDVPNDESDTAKATRIGGGRLEEMFMATSHAKFYTAINTVSVAPCIVGKSNMFRKSHLDYLTSTSSKYGPGLDFFSQNICEDHLIGDLLWRKQVAEEKAGQRWGRHALVFGDLAIQPMAGMSVQEYIARRVRWLRVRKWTVFVATFIEPGVESIVCSAYGAFALTTLPWFHRTFVLPQTWSAFAVLWLINMLVWVSVDWLVYHKLQACACVEVGENKPAFARPPQGGRRRPFKEWLAAWAGRELLALPIWTFAVYGGSTVIWRSKKFWVGMDMKVHEIKSDEQKRVSCASNGAVKSRRQGRID